MQQEKTMAFKPRKSTTERIPDAPEAKWKVQIKKGASKAKVTGNGDPQAILIFKILEAYDEKYESHVGSELTFRLIAFDAADPAKRGGANMTAMNVSSLCASLDLDKSEVWPTEISSLDDFKSFFDAVEGQTLDVWTVNRTRTVDGEEITNTDIRFKEPGGGMKLTSSDDDDNEDRPAAKKSPAKKGSRR